MRFFALFTLLCIEVSGLPAPTLSEQIHSAASRWSVDPKLVEAMIQVESRGKRHVTSPKGAMGLMQVMPKTAGESGIRDPFNPLDNLMGACRYLRVLMNRYPGRRQLPLVLAAYNAGPANVDKYRGIPPFRETQAYVRSVLSLYEKLQN